MKKINARETASPEAAEGVSPSAPPPSGVGRPTPPRRAKAEGKRGTGGPSPDQPEIPDPDASPRVSASPRRKSRKTLADDSAQNIAPLFREVPDGLSEDAPEEEATDDASEDLEDDLPDLLPEEDILPDMPLDALSDPDHVIDVSPAGDTLPVAAPRNLPSLHSRDNLQLYLREISRFPLLTPEEEATLTRRVRDAGDSDAAFRIISSHLRLVVKIAMDFQRRWMQNVLDLIQEGNVGLMRAVNKFDPDKGIKFSYYATFWIKAYILKFIMDNWRMVKIGTTQAQRKLFYNLNKERQKLVAQGFDPDAATLSERLGVTEEQVVEMQQRLDAGDVSLDISVGDESGSASRMDFLPALGPGIEDSLATSEIAELVRGGINELLPSLSEKEAYILEHRLLTDDPVTLREIGERYHVTRERIRQLEARLLSKLRTHLGSELRDFSEEWINP